MAIRGGCAPPAISNRSAEARWLAGATTSQTSPKLPFTSITAAANYVFGVLPRWLVVRIDNGLAFPKVYAAASADVGPHQTSTPTAVHGGDAAFRPHSRRPTH